MRTHQGSKKGYSAANSLVSRPFPVQPKLQENTESQGTQGYKSQIPEFTILNPVGDRAPLQPKLAIGSPGDKYEQEADQTAKLVLQRINAPGIPQSTPQPSIQRQGGLEGGEATPDLESAITSARSGGQPLDAGLQAKMSTAMGADFSGVRVHTDAQSDQLNRSIQARAFTTGQDVFFRQGEYQPGSRGGQELIAHELTHVLQQSSSQLQRKHFLQSANTIIQRAIGIHRVKDQENQNPPESEPVKTRQAWLKKLLQQEMGRIMNLQQGQNLVEVLTALGETNPKAANIVKEELLPYLQPRCTVVNYAERLTEDHILSINQILNELEVAMGTQAEASDTIANVLIGNEFTFTNSSLENLDAKDKDDLHEKMVKPYDLISTAWRNAMQTKGIKPVQDYKADRMTHLTYKFKNEEHKLDWGYKVTPDQKCVEIITDPAKASDLYSGHIANLIDTYIFGIAEEIGLKAHATIGGGHINIDEKTAFGAYSENNEQQAKKAAKVLAKFIENFYNNADYWESIDPDMANAAFPKDLKYKQDNKPKTKQADFEELILKFKKEGWKISKLADELMDKVFDINLVDAKKSESPHYQALNLEHLGSKETGKSRRLEVRRVPAQPNRQALIEQLNKIAELLSYSKN